MDKELTEEQCVQCMNEARMPEKITYWSGRVKEMVARRKSKWAKYDFLLQYKFLLQDVRDHKPWRAR
jgi:hypothetical protein